MVSGCGPCYRIATPPLNAGWRNGIDWRGACLGCVPREGAPESALVHRIQGRGRVPGELLQEGVEQLHGKSHA